MMTESVPEHGQGPTSVRRGAEPRTPEDQARAGTTWHGRHRSNAGHRATLLGDPYVGTDGQKHVEVKHKKQVRKPLLSSFLADFAIDPPAPPPAMPPAPPPFSAPAPFLPAGSLTVEGLALRVAAELESAGDHPGALWVRSVACGYPTFEALAKVLADGRPGVRSRLSADTAAALWAPEDPRADQPTELRAFVDEVLVYAATMGWRHTVASRQAALYAARTLEDVARALPAATAEGLPRALWLKLAPCAHLLQDGDASAPSAGASKGSEAGYAPLYVVGFTEGSEELDLLGKLVAHRNEELRDEQLVVTPEGMLRGILRGEARHRGLL